MMKWVHPARSGGSGTESVVSLEGTAEATRRTAGARGASAGRHIDFARDRAALRSAFPDRSLLVRHNLTDHPLLTVDALLELARRLPEKHVEYASGEVTVDQHGHAPANGLSAEETIRRIRDCKSWLALRNVEADDVYRELVEACIEEARVVVGDMIGPTSQHEGFIFLSSPGSLTPLHMDPEHNFLLQIRGSKELHLWDAWNRDIVAEEMLEQMHTATDDWARQKVSDNGVPATWRWDLVPGVGAYLPPEAPHWVQNGDEVSISLSFVFRSRYQQRKQSIHQFNAKLRRRGKTPVPVGRSALRDSVKAGIMKSGRAVKRLLGR